MLDTEQIAKRKDYLEELNFQFVMGEISVDPDDPRTTTGLTDAEVAFVRGEKVKWCELHGAGCNCGEAEDQ